MDPKLFAAKLDEVGAFDTSPTTPAFVSDGLLPRRLANTRLARNKIIQQVDSAIEKLLALRSTVQTGPIYTRESRKVYLNASLTLDSVLSRLDQRNADIRDFKKTNPKKGHTD